MISLRVIKVFQIQENVDCFYSENFCHYDIASINKAELVLKNCMSALFIYRSIYFIVLFFWALKRRGG